MLKVHTRNFGSVAIVAVQGRIVRGEFAALQKAMDSLSGATVIALDLCLVSTVDAGGLGLLLELREQLQSNGSAFKLLNVQKLVRKVLEITRLDSVFEIASSGEIFSLAARCQPVTMMEFAA